jgi:rhamnose transport system permease protein
MLDRLFRRGEIRSTTHIVSEEEFDVKNWQIGLLSGVILAAALIVAGSNWLLVRSIKNEKGPNSVTQTQPANSKKSVVAMMPKAKGDPYFMSCRKGAEEAAKELGVELLWDGPTDLDPAKQNEVVEAWITRGVDVIAVSVENKEGISTVLRKARAKGIKVVTWDADAEKDARDFFIDQATPQGIGETLTDEAARIMGGKGDFAIITASLSAANQNEWIKYIKQRLAEKYPDMKLVAIQPSEGDRDRAFQETQNVLKVYPNVKPGAKPEDPVTPMPEIGWGPVTFPFPGGTEPIVLGLMDGAPMFHWHFDTFDLPKLPAPSTPAPPTATTPASTNGPRSSAPTTAVTGWGWPSSVL